MSNRVIDVHVHVIPVWCGARHGVTSVKGERYGKVRIEGKGLERVMPPSFVNVSASAEMVLEYMEWVGVNKAVLMQAPVYGVHNEHISEVLAKYGDRFVGFGLLDPREEKAPDKVSYLIRNLGLRGIKFEIPDIPIWLDDEKYFPVWEKIQEEGGLIAFDLGWDKEDNPFCFQVKQLRKLLRRFPQMTVIVVHLGVSRLWDKSQRYPFPHLQETLGLAEFPKVWFELAAIPFLCEEEEYPYPRAQQIIQATYEEVGANRILWGSDWPTVLEAYTYRQCLNLVRNNCDFLSAQEKKRILAENAEELYRFGK